VRSRLKCWLLQLIASDYGPTATLKFFQRSSYKGMQNVLNYHKFWYASDLGPNCQVTHGHRLFINLLPPQGKPSYIFFFCLISAVQYAVYSAPPLSSYKFF